MKALNRKEVLVNAKANGTLDSFKPLTRDEAFTKKALGLGGGSGGGAVIFSMAETGLVCKVTYEKARDMLKNGANAIIRSERSTYDLDASAVYAIATKIEWLYPTDETAFIGFDFDTVNTKVVFYSDNHIELNP